MENKKIFKHKTFDELWNDPAYLTELQKTMIDFEVRLIGKLIEARESKGYTQQILAEKAGVKQSAIARLENMNATPRIDTLIKILKPLGYKLDIVKDEQEEIDESNTRVEKIIEKMNSIGCTSFLINDNVGDD